MPLQLMSSEHTTGIQEVIKTYNIALPVWGENRN